MRMIKRPAVSEHSIITDMSPAETPDQGFHPSVMQRV